MRDKDGKCPGGLSVKQYQRVEAGIGTIDDAATRADLTAKLQGGRIKIGTPKQFEESRDSPMGSSPSGTIYLNPDGSWEKLGAGSLGFGLGHEVGHKVHFDQLSPDQKNSFGTLIRSDSFIKAMERFADSVSCARGTHPGFGYLNACTPWRN